MDFEFQFWAVEQQRRRDIRALRLVREAQRARAAADAALPSPLTARRPRPFDAPRPMPRRPI